MSCQAKIPRYNTNAARVISFGGVLTIQPLQEANGYG